MSALLVSAALTGCTGLGQATEHPVNNLAPELKPGVYRVEAVDVRPVAIKDIEPDYPPELGSILSGKAIVVFTVRADGKVKDASVLQADDVLFGEAAVAAIVKWQFHPAQLHGAPVDCRMTLPFIFTSPYGYVYGEEGAPFTPPDAPGGSQHMTVESH